jgi:hypothetical protein
MKPAPQPTLFPAPPRERSTNRPEAVVSPIAERRVGTPRRPEVEAPAICPASDVAIYELTGPFTTWRWLCARDVKAANDAGWASKRMPGKVASCDACVLREQGVVS